MRKYIIAGIITIILLSFASFVFADISGENDRNRYDGKTIDDVVTCEVPDHFYCVATTDVNGKIVTKQWKSGKNREDAASRYYVQSLTLMLIADEGVNLCGSGEIPIEEYVPEDEFVKIVEVNGEKAYVGYMENKGTNQNTLYAVMEHENARIGLYLDYADRNNTKLFYKMLKSIKFKEKR